MIQDYRMYLMIKASMVDAAESVGYRSSIPTAKLIVMELESDKELSVEELDMRSKDLNRVIDELYSNMIKPSLSYKDFVSIKRDQTLNKLGV